MSPPPVATGPLCPGTQEGPSAAALPVSPHHGRRLGGGEASMAGRREQAGRTESRRIRPQPKAGVT